MMIHMTIYNKFLEKEKSVFLKLILTIFKVGVTVIFTVYLFFLKHTNYWFNSGKLHYRMRLPPTV